MLVEEPLDKVVLFPFFSKMSNAMIDELVVLKFTQRCFALSI